MPIQGNYHQQREAFGDAVFDPLAELAHNIKALTLHEHLMTRWESEQKVATRTEASPMRTHGRPAVLHETYTWVSRLPDTHSQLPLLRLRHASWGGITGKAGRQAAQEIIKDWR